MCRVRQPARPKCGSPQSSPTSSRRGLLTLSRQCEKDRDLGQLQYGDSLPSIDFDDRVLAHLKVVIFAKFRRHESFSFSWDHGTANGSGHSSIWLTAEIPVRFVFTGGRPPSLNRQWAERLMIEANSPSGLRIVPEPSETRRDPEPHT